MPLLLAALMAGCLWLFVLVVTSPVLLLLVPNRFWTPIRMPIYEGDVAAPPPKKKKKYINKSLTSALQDVGAER